MIALPSSSPTATIRIAALRTPDSPAVSGLRDSAARSGAVRLVEANGMDGCGGLGCVLINGSVPGTVIPCGSSFAATACSALAPDGDGSRPDQKLSAYAACATPPGSPPEHPAPRPARGPRLAEAPSRPPPEQASAPPAPVARTAPAARAMPAGPLHTSAVDRTRPRPAASGGAG